MDIVAFSMRNGRGSQDADLMRRSTLTRIPLALLGGGVLLRGLCSATFGTGRGVTRLGRRRDTPVAVQIELHQVGHMLELVPRRNGAFCERMTMQSFCASRLPTRLAMTIVCFAPLAAAAASEYFWPA